MPVDYKNKPTLCQKHIKIIKRFAILSFKKNKSYCKRYFKDADALEKKMIANINSTCSANTINELNKTPNSPKLLTALESYLKSVNYNAKTRASIINVNAHEDKEFVHIHAELLFYIKKLAFKINNDTLSKKLSDIFNISCAINHLQNFHLDYKYVVIFSKRTKILKNFLAYITSAIHPDILNLIVHTIEKIIPVLNVLSNHIINSGAISSVNINNAWENLIKWCEINKINYRSPAGIAYIYYNNTNQKYETCPLNNDIEQVKVIFDTIFEYPYFETAYELSNKIKRGHEKIIRKLNTKYPYSILRYLKN